MYNWICTCTILPIQKHQTITRAFLYISIHIDQYTMSSTYQRRQVSFAPEISGNVTNVRLNPNRTVTSPNVRQQPIYDMVGNVTGVFFVCWLFKSMFNIVRYVKEGVHEFTIFKTMRKWIRENKKISKNLIQAPLRVIKILEIISVMILLCLLVVAIITFLVLVIMMFYEKKRKDSAALAQACKPLSWWNTNYYDCQKFIRLAEENPWKNFKHDFTTINGLTASSFSLFKRLFDIMRFIGSHFLQAAFYILGKGLPDFL